MNKAASWLNRTIVIMLASVMMLVTVFGTANIIRAEDYETTYTVTIYPGAIGTGGIEVHTGLKYGDTVTYTVDPTAVNDDRYYAKGLKDSGMDNNEYTSDFITDPYLTTDGAGNWTITVTKDQDFVVSYGLKGSAVAYTINYVDGGGAPVANSTTYYGSVGDMAVISYLYVEGYVPRETTQSRALSANEADNVFTFVYDLYVAPTPEPTPAPVPTEAPTPAPTPAPVPEELVVIGDNDVPLAYYNEQTGNQYGFFIPGAEEGRGSAADGTEEIDEQDVPLANFSTGNVFSIKNDHLKFEYKYERKEKKDIITAFVGALADPA